MRTNYEKKHDLKINTRQTKLMTLRKQKEHYKKVFADIVETNKIFTYNFLRKVINYKKNCLSRKQS